MRTAIKPGAGADPWVLKYGDSYYMTYTTGNNVQVTKSGNLAQWAQTGMTVYTPPSPLGDVWAPELHYIQGAFYIYVAMDKNGDNAQHRMYVLKGRSTTDPTQPFDVSFVSVGMWKGALMDAVSQMVGQITSPDNNWAIDGTVLIVHPF